MIRMGDRDIRIETQQLWRCRRKLEHRLEIKEEPWTYGKEGRDSRLVSWVPALVTGACGQSSIWLFISRYAGAWLGRSYIVLETTFLWKCFSFTAVMDEASSKKHCPKAKTLPYYYFCMSLLVQKPRKPCKHISGRPTNCSPRMGSQSTQTRPCANSWR